MLTVEELLRPRYKVIADYPGNTIAIGTIIKPAGCWQDFTTIFWCQANDKYPHLFQPLPWWSDREISDLPAFVKVIREDCAKDTGLYCKVYKWHLYDDTFAYVKGQLGAELEGYSPSYLERTELNFPGQVYGRLNATLLEPATIEQYNQQKEGMK